mgnify:FL=1
MLLLVPKVNAAVALRAPPLRTISVSALPGVAPKLSEADTAIVPTLIFIAPVNDEFVPDNVRVPFPCLTNVPFPESVPVIALLPLSPVVKVSVSGIEKAPDPSTEAKVISLSRVKVELFLK